MVTETAPPNCCMHMVPSSIILEGKDTYKNWRACMESFLLAQGLWGIIQKEGLEDCEKKNAMALHAIQISCAPGVLSQIRDIKSAKDAWDNLSSLFQKEELPRAGAGAPNNKSSDILLKAYKYAHDGNLIDLNRCLAQHNLIEEKIPPSGGTILHIAAYGGRECIVEFLAPIVPPNVLEIKDGIGHTPLSFAAHIGNLKMVKCLVEAKNPEQLRIVNNEGNIPLVLACSRNYREVTRYLYHCTPLKVLVEEKDGNHGSLFLQRAIANGMLDLALDLLSQQPDLAIKFSKGSNAAIQLSKMPQAFFSSCELGFFARIFYYLLCTVCGSAMRPLKCILKCKGIMKIYDLKVTHEQSPKLLECICKHIRNLDFKEYEKHGIYKAFHKAVKYGIVEIISELVKVNPDFMYVGDKKERNMIQASIAYRQERVFSLLYGVEGSKAALIYVGDKHKNTVLHLAAMPSPPSRLDCISGAALQMQRELQWFKEVESIMDPVNKERKNEKGETASQLFTKSHKDLKKGGEEWMKETAKSSTTIGTLIITAMFSAALVAPGGNSIPNGFPLFSHKAPYIIFKISNTFSLFASSTAVLTFLGVLTSRYAEEDFLTSLPTKLVIGLFALFIAIVAMMVAFCAALLIILKAQWWLLTALILLACVPIILYLWFQSGLIVEVITSTRGVFNRTTKRWY